MSNKTISALTAATTPLAGTEVLPVVQGASTVRVTVADLTVGRAVNMATAETTGNVSIGAAVSGWGTGLGMKAVEIGKYGSVFAYNTPAVGLVHNAYYNSGWKYTSATYAGYYEIGYLGNQYWATAPVGVLGAAVTFTTRMTLGNATGDLTLNTGNLVQGTATKGTDFTANTPAAGMTSQLLNWYEEGTWTPNQGTGLTVVGAFSSNGTYVRIGRSVTVKGQVLGATTVAVAAAGVISSNLPFTAASGHAGSMHNAAIAVGGTIAITSTSATAASAVTATPSITFTATYQV